MFSKTIGKTLAVLATTSMLAAPASQAATGSVDVDITFPPLIILYYFDDIDITVDPGDLQDLITNGNAALSGCVAGSGTNAELECVTDTSPLALGGAGTVASTTITYDADISTDANVSPGVVADISFDIDNAWAVRALATSLTASVTGGGGDFTSVGTSLTSPTPSLTLGAGNTGDIQFDVDLTALVGLTAADTLTITVVAP